MRWYADALPGAKPDISYLSNRPLGTDVSRLSRIHETEIASKNEEQTREIDGVTYPVSVKELDIE